MPVWSRKRFAPSERVIYNQPIYSSNLTEVVDRQVRNWSESVTRFAGEIQLVLPYWGTFSANCGTNDFLLDSNHALFVSRGCVYTERPISTPASYSVILLTIGDELLRTLGIAIDTLRERIPMDRPLSVTPSLRALTHRWLCELQGTASDRVILDALVIATVCEATNLLSIPRPEGSKLVRRAKEILHHPSNMNLSVNVVARMLDVTEKHLTSMFTKCEGISFYRYQLNLRLARAMLELPKCVDITDLALELEFSSHSHFSTSFKTFSSMTPSLFRRRLGDMTPSFRAPPMWS